MLQGIVRVSAGYSGIEMRSIFINALPAVKFRLVVDLDILGLPGSRTVSTQVTDASCPMELPVNSV